MKSFCSRFLIRGMAAAGLCAGLLALACSRPASPPNFLFLLVDTLRYDYLGYTGFKGPISPNVDALAQESFVFQRAYAASPWTKPSMASLFTSLHPVVHGVTNHKGGMWGDDDPDLQKGVLRSDANTLAEAMKSRGYDTAGFVGNPWMTWEYGFDQGFDVYSSVVEPPADRITLEAERWLNAREGTKPYFLYLHFMDVHGPYNAPDSVYEFIRNSPSLQIDTPLSVEGRDRVATMLSYSRWARDADGNPTPETLKLETWMARYAAGVRDFDNRVGSFLKHMKESGALDNTYVIFTSDHGEELYDHGNWDHGYTLFEDQIRVPLLIRPPGGVEEPQVVENVVGLIDLFPTLVGLAGGTSTGTEGSDLSPILNGTGPGGSRVVFSSGVRNNRQLSSLVAGSYKVILNGMVNQLAFFDVIQDPKETRSLAAEKPEELKKMRGLLGVILESQQKSSLFTPSEQPMSPAKEELLRSLGYMN